MSNLKERLKEGVTPVLSRERMITAYIHGCKEGTSLFPDLQEGQLLSITFEAHQTIDGIRFADPVVVDCTSEEYFYVLAKMKLKGDVT